LIALTADEVGSNQATMKLFSNCSKLENITQQATSFIENRNNEGEILDRDEYADPASSLNAMQSINE
jgi:hypothetical protein